MVGNAYGPPGGIGTLEQSAQGEIVSFRLNPRRL